MNYWSPRAAPVAHPRAERKLKLPQRGVCVHTTGSGVLTRADQRWRGLSNPLDVAVSIYSDPGANFPHYVIGERVAQVAGEDVRAWHAGVQGEQRQLYASNTWRRKVSAVTAAMWDQAWPGKSSPLAITADPNDSHVGVELVPLVGSTFTDAQYGLLADLVADIFLRHGWGLGLPDPRPFWALARAHGLLVGHEDVNILERSNAGGGWDPGFLRISPLFHWDKLFDELARASHEQGEA